MVKIKIFFQIKPARLLTVEDNRQVLRKNWRKEEENLGSGKKRKHTQDVGVPWDKKMTCLEETAWGSGKTWEPDTLKLESHFV